MNTFFRKTIISAAVTVAMGASAVASADTLNYTFNGLFTMVNSGGSVVANATTAPEAAYWSKYRTQITGTMSFDTVTGMGTGTVGQFHFNGDTAQFLANAHNITFQSIGNGAGGPGSLVLGNMGFDWNGTTGIPVSIVMDAAGMFAAIPTMTVGSSIGSAGPFPMTTAGGATPATNGFSVTSKTGTVSYAIGTVPIATTTWNTTTIPGSGMGSNVSGSMPLIADTVGGSPMIAGPFTGFNANFDITRMTLTSKVAAVPVPAAAWLLGSGLVGLVGVARRRKAV